LYSSGKLGAPKHLAWNGRTRYSVRGVTAPSFRCITPPCWITVQQEPRMRRKRWSSLALAVFFGTGCFHQIVQTGNPASGTIIDKPFVNGWLWGLVPNNEVDVRRECPSGVAVIETETSFVNGLVSAVTLGIYTPQHVHITCASRSASLPRGLRQVTIPVDASAAVEEALVRQAVETSAETHAPVALRY
jgi:hypothetical protein